MVNGKISVIGLPVDVATYTSALGKCVELARRDRSAAVSAANTHIVAAARNDHAFGNVMHTFEMVLPDGMPLVWVMNHKLRRAGKPILKDRVYGPYFMKYAIEHAPVQTRHFLFGASQECLDELQAAIKRLRPDVQIAGTCSPPYRQWTEADQSQFAKGINEANADFVWVALGGEKQEMWIVENLHRFNRGVFFAVGDAFELLAGRRPFAPDWVQNHGVTWLYRLVQEPRQMWKRYLKYNSLFLLYLMKDVLSPSCESVADSNLSDMPQFRDDRANVLGVGVSATSMPLGVAQLLVARERGERGYVCVTGVHGVMESQRDEELRQIHNQSLMTVPDGMPTVWMGHEYGFTKMDRVYGPDLMLELCAATSGTVESGRGDVEGGASENVEGGQHPTSNIQRSTTNRKCFSHFLYGSTEETLRKLKANLERKFPGIQIVGTYAPPFRPLTDDEELELQQVVADCKPDFFWVGLSTPKQERFMFEHCSNMIVGDEKWKVESGGQHSTSNISHLTAKFPLDAGILLGVGAAFDIHAGNMKDTPKWIQNAGLQWLHRLCKEPRRLWRRYFWIVPGFIWLAFLQVMGLRKWDLD